MVMLIESSTTSDVAPDAVKDCVDVDVRSGNVMLRGWQRKAVFAAAVLAISSVGVGTASAETRDDYEPVEFEDPYDPAPRESFVSTDRSVRPMLSTESMIAMQSAIAKYEYVVSRGGWRTIPPGRNMSVGSRGDRVVMLRDRLAITGDLQQVSAESGRFDASLDEAVRRFQLRMGIPATGVVDPKTLETLNVPARDRLRTLQVNLPRIAELSKGLQGRFVVVNIPAAEIEAVEDGFVYSRHVGIVGKPDRQTPVISSKISELNFNPFWTVPASIVRKDLLPKLREDPGYLQRMNMRVHTEFGGPEVDPSNIDWNVVEEDTYLFRQDPGRINSMGTVKINFPNKHAVYLHDTPTKSLFSEAARLFSSGCVRVDKVHVLTEWLLRGQEQWDRGAIDQVASAGERLDVVLEKPVPLRIVYLTAWAKADGGVSFREDIYDRDDVSVAAVDGVATQ